MNTKVKIGILKKMLILLSITILISFFSVAFLTQITTIESFKQNAIETNLERMETKAEILEIYLEQLRRLSNNIYSNTDVYNLLGEEELTQQSSYRIFLFLRSLMSMPGENSLFQIYLDLYSSGQSFLISSNGYSYGPSRYHINLPSYLAPGTAYGDGARLSSTYGYSLSGSGTPIYSFHWNIYDSTVTKILGTISFDVEISALKNIPFKDIEDESIYYMLQETGDLIFANRAPLDTQTVRDILFSCKDSGWAEITTNSYSGVAFTHYASLDNLEFYLLEVIPHDRIYGVVNRIFILNAFIIIFAFLVCSISVIVIVRQITRPLRQLDSYLKAVDNQGISEKISDYVNYNSSDEIGNVIMHTQKMMDTIQEMFIRQEQLGEAQRAAENKMLQAQINPHFLYNSLQSIASLALQHGDRETFEYITMLGSRMQYSMNLAQPTAQLKQEFKYVESYLHLQNIRFGHPVEPHIILSPEAEEIIVPKMILQPFAENSFKHGQLCRHEAGEFRLTAECKNSVLEIICEDSGNGCSLEQIAMLNHQLEHTENYVAGSATSIGLINVACRLRLFFKTQTSIVLSPSSKGGVKAIITIPLGENSLER